ncbi:MAG TPA: hypothetical protein VFP31_04130 [Gaiellaceae bacterium]|nr:hypothetical protein [Gaiellaceae bacterium]
MFGTNDYAPGPVRVSFLVVTHRARSVERPTARVWLSRGLNQKPFRTGTARLEAIGGGQKIYVTRLDVPSAGTYWLLAEPVGGAKKIQGVGNVVVQKDSRSPALGDDAFPSKNPTLDDAPAEQITTARPPDTELLRTSIKNALDRHEPFVVVFATPKYCQSRTCGPVVGIVERVGERFASTSVRFIHVEVYEGNNPALGENRWFKEWKLQSEPWVFLVGPDGKIKARFEGPVSERELGDAVSEFLT